MPSATSTRRSQREELDGTTAAEDSGLGLPLVLRSGLLRRVASATSTRIDRILWRCDASPPIPYILLSCLEDPSASRSSAVRLGARPYVTSSQDRKTPFHACRRETRRPRSRGRRSTAIRRRKETHHVMLAAADSRLELPSGNSTLINTDVVLSVSIRVHQW